LAVSERVCVRPAAAQILPLLKAVKSGRFPERRSVVVVALMTVGLAACSEPLTTREKDAAIGTVGGAAVGGIIGRRLVIPLLVRPSTCDGTRQRNVDR